MASRSLARSSFVRLIAAAVALSGAVGTVSADINIPTLAGPGAPSFRGAPATTWFGWSTGTFDGTPDNGVLDNPTPTLGTTTAGVGLQQNDPLAVTISGSNNIYSAGSNLDITITAPTAGTPDSGFTTIIVQGRTAFGPFGTALNFAPVGGDVADVVVGTNAASAGQFFAKYEVPGNVASYAIQITGGSNNSINNLQVDTFWSASGYASDFAITPEPATLAVVASVGGTTLLRRRRVV
jgi:hypothetical protein